jgi:hypothetical protein
LFDLGAADASALERPLPTATEVPVRERLRWEKELLGLYLSEHPMGEVAERVSQYVSAYSTDLRDESLDGQRVVVAGIVTGRRTVVTKAKAAMAIVTMEDLQGSIEVVVFPRLFETTGTAWREGAILLVAGRVDHKGEDIALLADMVADWDDASATGPEAFARQVAAADRGGRRAPAGGNGTSYGAPRFSQPGSPPPVPPAEAAGPGAPIRPLVGVGPGAAARPPVGPGSVAPVVGAALPRRQVPYVSPRRGGGAGSVDLPPIAPAEPVAAHVELPGGVRPSDDRDEPPVPDEARARIVADATADAPVDAGPNTVLHVRFASVAPSDRVVVAMETFKAVLRDRPGETRVVIHVPGPGGGTALPMELRRGVAYDAELLAEIRRRLGEGIVEIHLGSA